jgi:hypothetical protein
MKRRLVVIAVAPLLAACIAIAIIAWPGRALALPTGCQLQTTSRAVAAYCSGGSGYYRAAGKVRWSSGAYSYIYGSWTRPGCCGESYVNASSGATVVAGYLQKKA